MTDPDYIEVNWIEEVTVNKVKWRIPRTSLVPRSALIEGLAAKLDTDEGLQHQGEYAAEVDDGE